MSLTPQTFPTALHHLLLGQHKRTSTTPSWAPQHTAAIDTYLAPARVLELVALSLPSTVPPTPELKASKGRPLYRALLVYSLARAGSRDPQLLAFAQAQIAAQVSYIEAAFYSLTIEIYSQSPSTFFQTLLTQQRSSGEFLDASPYDSPDLHWYDELVLLHALASHQALFPSPATLSALEKSARFHTAETQPDHASTQPWALHAFGIHQDTLPLADLLLHGALAQNAGHLDAPSRLLIADALLALRGGVRS